MEDDNYQPLLSPLTTTSSSITAPHGRHDEVDNPKHISSSSSIISRLVFLFLICSISIWANHEASKGFTISIVNESRDTISGNRFQLFYVSNDEATRILMKTSKIVENFLYPDIDHHIHVKKHVNHVIIRFGNQNGIHNVNVDFSIGHGQIVVININPSIMEGKNFRDDMLVALQRGVARTWIWDGQGRAPENLANGIVEYIVRHKLGGVDKSLVHAPDPVRTADVGACWKREDFRKIAEFLYYCERRNDGFIRRLNEAMKDTWNDSRLDIALGHSIGKLCTTYDSLHHDIFAM